MIKYLATRTILCLLLLLLVACTAPPEPTPVVIDPNSGLIYISYAVPEWEIQWGPWAALVKEFEDRNPDIRIILKTYNEILGQPPLEFEPPKDFWLQIASSSDAFKITFFDGIGNQMVDDGLVNDLEPFIAADSNFDNDDFIEGALEASSWDGAVWAIPTDLTYELFVYNKDLFDSAGLAYPQNGWSWDDFESTVRSLSRSNTEDEPFWSFAMNGGIPRLARLIELRTGSLVENSAESPSLRFDAQEVEEVVQWWRQLAVEDQIITFHDIPRAEDGSGRLIESGSVAMMPDMVAVGIAASANPQQIGAVAFPIDQSNQTTTPAIIHQISMSAGAANPNATWKWIEFVSRQAPFYPGEVPARRSVAEASGFWDALDEETANTVRFAMEHTAPPSLLRRD